VNVVDNNPITSNGNLQSTMVGIRMSDSEGSSVRNSNTMDDLGIGLLFANSNIDLIPQGNNINNCENSIVLYFNIFNNLGNALGSKNSPVNNTITNSINADYVLIHNSLDSVEDNIKQNYWYTNDFCGGVDKYYEDGAPFPVLLTQVFPCSSILKKPVGASCPVTGPFTFPCAPPLPNFPTPPACEIERFRTKYIEERSGYEKWAA